MKQNLDALDWAIVAQLSSNARLSTRRIASRLPLSEATVRRRLKRLVDAEVVSLRALIDPTSLGFNIEAIIGLSVQMDRVTRVVEQLRKSENVVYVSVVSGRFDIAFLGVFKSVEDLLKFMETEVGTLEGVKGTETLICLRIEKGKHVFLGGQAEKNAYPHAELRRSRRARVEKELEPEKPAPEPVRKTSPSKAKKGGRRR